MNSQGDNSILIKLLVGLFRSIQPVIERFIYSIFKCNGIYSA